MSLPKNIVYQQRGTWALRKDLPVPSVAGLVA